MTSAIRQEGANQVSIITSTAEKQAAAEFARAAAMRPRIAGAALKTISRDAQIAEAMFRILEAEKIAEGEADITLVPKGSQFLAELAAMQDVGKPGEGQ